MSGLESLETVAFIQLRIDDITSMFDTSIPLSIVLSGHKIAKRRFIVYLKIDTRTSVNAI